MSRSSLLTGLFALCLLAPVGCASAISEDNSEEAAETQDELSLSSAAHALVGKYYDPEVPFGAIGRIRLSPNGEYSAEVDAAGQVSCVTWPCLLPESGTWNAHRRANGGIRLRLRPTGQRARWYEAKKNGSQLLLTREGRTQTLTELAQKQCLDTADCRADEACRPKACLMFCAVGDPFCCGPSTCMPKPAPKKCGGIAAIPCGPNEECVDDPTDSCDPNAGGADCSGICKPKVSPWPPACWGAWVDENGLCRTPADGVYPPECCGGPRCGEAQCGAGEVCCNPLAGICTKPGHVCVF